MSEAEEEEEEEGSYYGTPLEPYDEDSFPKKKPITIEEQVARDAQGRRRFHGAFTGGFSAGFFNTVGSLEGWTPTEFRSSRSEKALNNKQIPEDYMDDEDLSEFGIAPQTVRATDEYNDSKKRKKQVQHSDGPIPGTPVLETLLEAGNETVGYFLIKNMNRKHHQHTNTAVKVYGCAMPTNFEDDSPTNEFNLHDCYKYFLKAPKSNSSGLGYTSLDKTHLNLYQPSKLTVRERNNKKLSISGQAFGVGAFENEDEDIYVKDDMSRYDFELTTESAAKEKPTKTEQLLFDMFVVSNKTALFNNKKADRSIYCQILQLVSYCVNVKRFLVFIILIRLVSGCVLYENNTRILGISSRYITTSATIMTEIMSDMQKCNMQPASPESTEVRCQEKTRGGLCYEVILSEPEMKTTPKRPTSPPNKNLSIEDIESKLKAAEDRRQQLELSRLAALSAQIMKIEEATRKKDEQTSNFITNTREALDQKMENHVEKREAYINDLKTKVKDHLETVEKTRLSLEQQCDEVRNVLEEKMKNASTHRDENLKKMIDRLKDHEDQVQRVRTSNTEKFQQLENAIQDKLGQAQVRREHLEQEQIEKLRTHNTRAVEIKSIHEVRKNEVFVKLETKLTSAEQNREKEIQKIIECAKKHEKRAEIVRQNKANASESPIAASSG